jgi:ssDNA-binding Zn-finger/Zn-ribbon topoisomerase 1
VCQGKVLKYTGWWGPYFQCETPDCNAIDKRSGEKMEAIGECPNCGKPVIKKMGQYGEFLSCSGYPGCKTICVFDDNGNLIEKVKGQSGGTAAKSSGGASLGACPNCGADVIEKTGKFGIFMSCSAYPKCKTICVWDNGALVEKAPGQKSTVSGGAKNANNAGSPGKSVGKCPNCGADVVEKQGKFGPFMSCSAYPNCRTICVRDGSGNLIEKGKNPPPPQNDDEPF